jgi:histone acetyltransferase
MPKEYIVRLLFDRRHFVLTMRKDGELLGGCCFRPFRESVSGGGLFEITFLAVSSSEQVKGYGTLIMSTLKSLAQRCDVKEFVTYADVAAVGYFTKQGFFGQSGQIPSEWQGHIKDYDGAHLMRCRVLPGVDYGKGLSEFLVTIKDDLWNSVKKNLTADQKVVYAGLKSRPSRIEAIPGVVAAPAGSLETQISDILESAFAHKSSWPFQEPVELKDAPDYNDVVACPTDLGSMRRRNVQRGFRSAESFRLEMKLMFANCYLYNGPSSVYSKEGVVLEKFLQPRIDRLCEEQGSGSSQQRTSSPEISSPERRRVIRN